MKGVLDYRIHHEYTPIIFVCIVLQLGIPLFVFLRYRDAIRVFAQRDDGESYLPRWVRALLPEKLVRKAGRTVTGLLEDGQQGGVGGRDESYELPDTPLLSEPGVTHLSEQVTASSSTVPRSWTWPRERRTNL